MIKSFKNKILYDYRNVLLASIGLADVGRSQKMILQIRKMIVTTLNR